MLNKVWAFLVISGLLVAGLLGRLSGEGGVVGSALDSTKTAVMSIALPLAGMMMFWLGVLRLIEKAGVLTFIAHALSPLMKRLFPEVPPEHPAMSAMIMNLGANMLGLGNSATPLGLKAMGHLQELNPAKRAPSNAMCIFLALNTAGFSLIPTSAITYLSAAGVKEPYRVIGPTILATACAAILAVLVCKLLQGLPMFAVKPEDIGDAETPATDEATKEPSRISTRAKVWLALLVLAFIGVAALELEHDTWRPTLLHATGLDSLLDRASSATKSAPAAAATAAVQLTGWKLWINGASGLAIPAILLLAVSLALARGVKVYEEFVEGAKEGFGVATRIMPFLVAMLAAIALFKGSGILMLIGYLLKPILDFIGFPVDLLPLALMRPLSGSGSLGLLNEILTNPGSTEALKFSAAILYGSTETTFYVLAVYFGSVGIRKARHALAAGLTADAVGMTAAVVFGKLLFS
ncbi:MAG: Spore maturation protein SpmA [Verrucomicrobiaceae bacterium]|nr:Spore maturation protein SpmA [Verrucomicrobiaceae bacterium]